MAAPAPTTIALHVGGGVNGASRIELAWADEAIKNTWLQITVKATAATGLLHDDVFYFGNAAGESGNDVANAIVNSTDELAARNNPQTFLDSAAIDNLFDYNRDGFVNATDQIIARSGGTTLATALRLINVPGPLLANAARLQPVEVEDNAIAAGLAVPVKKEFVPSITSATAVASPVHLPLLHMRATIVTPVSVYPRYLRCDIARPDHNLATNDNLYELIAIDSLSTQPQRQLLTGIQDDCKVPGKGVRYMFSGSVV